MKTFNGKKKQQICPANENIDKSEKICKHYMTYMHV